MDKNRPIIVRYGEIGVKKVCSQKKIRKKINIQH